MKDLHINQKSIINGVKRLIRGLCRESSRVKNTNHILMNNERPVSMHSYCRDLLPKDRSWCRWVGLQVSHAPAVKIPTQSPLAQLGSGEENNRKWSCRGATVELQWSHSALRLMTWTNNFSKTFLIFASLIPFFRLIIPEKCFYQ